MVPGATDPSVPLDPNEQQQEIPPGKIAGGRPQRCSSLWQSIPTDMSVGVIPWSGRTALHASAATQCMLKL